MNLICLCRRQRQIKFIPKAFEIFWFEIKDFIPKANHKQEDWIGIIKQEDFVLCLCHVMPMHCRWFAMIRYFEIEDLICRRQIYSSLHKIEDFILCYEFEDALGLGIENFNKFGMSFWFITFALGIKDFTVSKRSLRWIYQKQIYTTRCAMKFPISLSKMILIFDS